MTAITASHLSRRLQFSCPFSSSVMTASIGNLRGIVITLDALIQFKSLAANLPIRLIRKAQGTFYGAFTTGCTEMTGFHS
jgi:hypothetical protein